MNFEAIPARVLAGAVLGLLLAGCRPDPAALPIATTPSGAAAGPATSNVSPDAYLGKWGLAAYHRDQDRARTEKEARAQCGNPYVITKGPNGGMMMNVADDKELYELQAKAGPGGKTYIGPAGPVDVGYDREVVSQDANQFTVKFLDPDVAARYGTMIYVRCGARNA
jgi:hypothetical protein